MDAWRGALEPTGHPPRCLGFSEHLFDWQPANLGRTCDRYPDLAAALEPDCDAVTVTATVERCLCSARAFRMLRVGDTFFQGSGRFCRRIAGALPDGGLRGAYVHLQPPCVAHAAGAKRDGSSNQIGRRDTYLPIYACTSQKTSFGRLGASVSTTGRAKRQRSLQKNLIGWRASAPETCRNAPPWTRLEGLSAHL